MNYIKSSWLFFLCVSKYLDIPIKYISYRKNQHIFIKRFWRILVWGYWDILKPKNQTRGKNHSKIIQRSFRTISSLHEWFLVLKCLDTPSLHIAYKKNKQLLGLTIFELYQVLIWWVYVELIAKNLKCQNIYFVI